MLPIALVPLKNTLSVSDIRPVGVILIHPRCVRGETIAEQLMGPTVQPVLVGELKTKAIQIALRDGAGLNALAE